MARKGRTEEEISRVLREAESGETVVEVCRKHGISQQSFYLWKKKYAGLGLNELRELRQLREEKNINSTDLQNDLAVLKTAEQPRAALLDTIAPSVELFLNAVKKGYRMKASKKCTVQLHDHTSRTNSPPVLGAVADVEGFRRDRSATAGRTGRQRWMMQWVFGVCLLSLMVGTAIPSFAAPADASGPLAATPSMGWNDWAHYECNFNAQTILSNAKALVASSLSKRGYNSLQHFVRYCLWI